MRRRGSFMAFSVLRSGPTMSVGLFLVASHAQNNTISLSNTTYIFKFSLDYEMSGVEFLLRKVI